MNTIQGSKYVMSKYGEVMTLFKDTLLKVQQETRDIINIVQLDDLTDIRDIKSMYKDKSKQDIYVASRRRSTRDAELHYKFDNSIGKAKESTSINSRRNSRSDHKPSKQLIDKTIRKNALIQKLEKDLNNLEITGRTAWLWGFIYFSNYLRVFQSPLQQERNIPRKHVPVCNVTLDDTSILPTNRFRPTNIYRL